MIKFRFYFCWWHNTNNYIRLTRPMWRNMCR